jgi:hypothetical protein
MIANVTYGYTSANFSGRMPCVEVPFIVHLFPIIVIIIVIISCVRLTVCVRVSCVCVVCACVCVVSIRSRIP